MDARTLLAEHPARVARLKAIKAMLKHHRYSEENNEASIIEMLALTRAPFDGMPRAPSQKSRTEYAALNMDKLRREEQQDIRIHIKELQSEMAKLKCFVALYDACMCCLTEKEQHIAILYFQKNLSVEGIAAQLPEGMTFSKSTIRRMINRILQKVQYVIER